jgi:23S rRNA (cytidine1920-2'-O)/16S rRNA (cytidine1409-2'-O)-methyltransferase
MTRTRLDTLLVERGLAGSRERARALILAGQVTIEGEVASKAGTLVSAGVAVALRQDPRVVVLEGRNARSLQPADLPGLADVVTVDVSFISLAKILPRAAAVLQPGGDLVALVKPQFEAGRAEVGKKGLVRDPAVHARVIARITEAAAAAGLVRVGMTPSPITGTAGNQEFFLHLKAARDMEPAERGAHD